MLPPGDTPAANSEGAGGQQPFVIVSEHGQRSDESRRIVRAQAARASAAQSRVTRARNRETNNAARDGGASQPTDQPARQSGPPASAPAPVESALGTAWEAMPLATWLTKIASVTASSVAERTAGLAIAGPQAMASVAPALGSSMMPGLSSAPTPFQLPLALPRGFSALEQRLPVSGLLLNLLSRTACIDFASPGVEERLHQLLFDLVIQTAGAALSPQPVHPIQGHLRVACVCLTIFQGQRANGQCFSRDSKYQDGLTAAWSEAVLLDKQALSEPKAAEASLWAVFMISVTTGATIDFFQQQIQGLLNDLQLRYWEQVRKVLLDFIYPVSFLDESCKSFYQNLQPMQMVPV